MTFLFICRLLIKCRPDGSFCELVAVFIVCRKSFDDVLINMSAVKGGSKLDVTEIEIIYQYSHTVV